MLYNLLDGAIIDFDEDMQEQLQEVQEILTDISSQTDGVHSKQSSLNKSPSSENAILETLNDSIGSDSEYKEGSL